MRLHDYPASANCFKVRLLLAQLGLDCERVEVDIFGGDTLTDEFARLNPARMTPVLETEAATAARVERDPGAPRRGQRAAARQTRPSAPR